MEAYYCRVSLRRPGLFLLAWLLMIAAPLCHGQSPGMRRDAAASGEMAANHLLPNAPEVRGAEETAGGVICGTVLDGNGAEVTGATVVLEGGNGKDQRGATTDG